MNARRLPWRQLHIRKTTVLTKSLEPSKKQIDIVEKACNSLEWQDARKFPDDPNDSKNNLKNISNALSRMREDVAKLRTTEGWDDSILFYYDDLSIRHTGLPKSIIHFVSCFCEFISNPEFEVQNTHQEELNNIMDRGHWENPATRSWIGGQLTHP